MEKNNINELAKSLKHAINGLKNIKKSLFSADKFLAKINSSFLAIEKLTDEYNNKNIQSMYENNELYTFFIDETNTNLQKLDYDNQNLTKQLENDLKRLTEELELNNRSSIQKYREYDNEFIPKFLFLTEDKKANKEVYINNIIEINKERIKNLQEYEKISDDSDSKNEAKQYDFKHNSERFLAKYNENIEMLQQDFQKQIDEIINEEKIQLEKLDQEIKAKEKIIADNTVALNNRITALSDEYEKRLIYGYIPHDLERSQLLTEYEKKTHSYAIVEEQILTSFKNHLQETDNKIQELKQQQQSLDSEYHKTVNSYRQKHNKKVNISLAKYNSQINKAKHQFQKTNDANIQKEIRKLTIQRRHYIRKMSLILTSDIQKIDKEYISKMNDIIAQFETLRTNKTKYEAIKSNAMKNLNGEKDITTNILNNNLEVITKEKDSFAATDHCEENQIVANMRKERDIENANINYEINEMERQKRHIEYMTKHQIAKIKVQHEYQQSMLSINLQYQKDTLENRINNSNIVNMLEVQKNDILKKYQNDIAKAKADFENVKNSLYNDCDNLQFELYTLEHDYLNKKIDAEMEMRSKACDNQKQYAETLAEHERRFLTNLSSYSENVARANLYKKRFEIEKNMIYDAYHLFKKSLSLIINIENGFLYAIAGFTEPVFKEHHQAIISSFEYLRQIKLEILHEYLEHEFTIINARINFEKGVKYNKIIENLSKENHNSIEQLTARRDKLMQTISNYQNTIKIFEKSQNDLKDENKKLSRLASNSERNGNRYEIISNVAHIKTLSKQIKANQRNIADLSITLAEVNKAMNQQQNKYDKQINRIKKYQEYETKNYYKVLSLIRNQYNSLRGKINLSTNYLSASRYIFKSVEKNNDFILKNNGELLIDVKNYYKIHANYLNSSVNKDIKILENNYLKTYLRTDRQVYLSKQTEIKSTHAKSNAISNSYRASIEAINRNYIYEKNNLFQKLNNLMNHYFLDYKKHNNYLLERQNENDMQLMCHEENMNMYLQHYLDVTKKNKADYSIAIHRAKKILALNNKDLNEQLKSFIKHDNTRHISNNQIKINTIMEIIYDYHANIKRYKARAKSINHDCKSLKQNTEFENMRAYNNYIIRQKSSRKDFYKQLDLLDKRCQKQIKLKQRECKKNFWKN